VIGQERRLRSLFKQLVQNAVEAMADRSVKVRELTILTHARKEILEVEISDSGPGIPADQRVKVFQPFYSTKKTSTGFRGMGLSMVHEIVADHAGTVYFDADYRDGCRVIVQLPLTISN